MKKIYAFEVRKDEVEYFHQLEEKYGVEIILSNDVLTLENIEKIEEGSGVSILGMGHYRKEEMEAFQQRQIQYISTRTIGYNHVDLEAAKEHGIHVCNARYAPNGVADYTVMMILLCLRHYKQALWRIQVNDYSLPGLLGKEMKDLTIGIIGTGRIGTQVIRNLSGFGCQVLAYDCFQNEEVKKYAKYVELDEIYKQCDVISVHLALNEETYHMIDKESISRMKDGVVLINCARGGLMDISALIDGIEQEKIGALGLDTVEEEENIVHKNLKTDIFADRNIAYLRQFKNVVYTHHMAFYTDAAVYEMVNFGVQGLMDMEKGLECPTQLC